MLFSVSRNYKVPDLNMLTVGDGVVRTFARFPCSSGHASGREGTATFQRRECSLSGLCCLVSAMRQSVSESTRSFYLLFVSVLFVSWQAVPSFPCPLPNMIPT